jgi:hypothetical protein
MPSLYQWQDLLQRSRTTESGGTRAGERNRERWRRDDRRLRPVTPREPRVLDWR